MVDNQRGNCTLEVYSPNHLVFHNKLSEKNQGVPVVAPRWEAVLLPGPLSNVASAIIFKVTTTYQHF